MIDVHVVRGVSAVTQTHIVRARTKDVFNNFFVLSGHRLFEGELHAGTARGV